MPEEDQSWGEDNAQLQGYVEVLGGVYEEDRDGSRGTQAGEESGHAGGKGTPLVCEQDCTDETVFRTR